MYKWGLLCAGLCGESQQVPCLSRLRPRLLEADGLPEPHSSYPSGSRNFGDGSWRSCTWLTSEALSINGCRNTKVKSEKTNQPSTAWMAAARSLPTCQCQHVAYMETPQELLMHVNSSQKQPLRGPERHVE